MPFSLDIHFGYRNSTFTKEDMDIDAANASFTAGAAKFDSEFQDRIVNANSKSAKTEEVDSLTLQKAEHLAEKQVTDTASWTDAELATGKYALSNMLGSMTYMHGDRMILQDGAVVKEADATLFAVVPDRPDHAHGFMWDEGFHQHLISVWDMNLTMEVISSWFNQAD